MAKAQNKTVETQESVTSFLNSIADASRRTDCFALAEIMKKQSGFDPKMWGPRIVGFGSYHYKYDSGREGDAPLIAFAPRKSEISLYLSSAFEDRDALLKKFGKHKSGKGCIYIKKLQDVDTEILRKMVALSISHIKKLYT